MYDGFFDIEKELKKLPAKPGVYIMHDRKDEIIYVGKAISLKNRVKQYFQSSRNLSSKIRQMVANKMIGTIIPADINAVVVFRLFLLLPCFE